MNNPNPENIRVLFVTPWYPPDAGIFIQRHAQSISIYCNIIILYICPTCESVKEKYSILDQLETEYNLRVIRIHYHISSRNLPVVTKISEFLHYFIANYKGYQYASQKYGPFSLIHVNILSRTVILPFFLNFFKNIPYIITEHWGRYLPENNSYKGFFRKKFMKIAVRHASGLSTVSIHLGNQMLKQHLLNKNQSIIPNAIDTKLFSPSGNSFSQVKKRFIHISSFNEKAKNISGILRMISRLSSIRKDFECHFIGGREPYNQQAIEYAIELGVKDIYAFFDGILYEESLVDAIQKSCFLLMFSNYETFSIVIPESWACGIPVLSTRVGGIADYFNHDFGIECPVGDERSLLQKTNFMLDHYHLFDRGKMRAYVIQNFSYQTIGKQFLEFYNTALTRLLTGKLYQSGHK